MEIENFVKNFSPKIVQILGQFKIQIFFDESEILLKTPQNGEILVAKKNSVEKISAEYFDGKIHFFCADKNMKKIIFADGKIATSPVIYEFEIANNSIKLDGDECKIAPQKKFLAELISENRENAEIEVARILEKFSKTKKIAPQKNKKLEILVTKFPDSPTIWEFNGAMWNAENPHFAPKTKIEFEKFLEK